MSNNNAGHLYGESVIKGDYFAVETTNGNKPMEYTTTNGLILKELAEPVSESDAATKKYVDDNAGGGGGSPTFIEIDVTMIDTGNYNQTIGEAINVAYDAGQQVIIKQPIPLENEDYYYYLFDVQKTSTSRCYSFYQIYHGGLSEGVITSAGIALCSIGYTNNTWSITNGYCEFQIV